jgi:hypothetical protein
MFGIVGINTHLRAVQLANTLGDKFVTTHVRSHETRVRGPFEDLDNCVAEKKVWQHHERRPSRSIDELETTTGKIIVRHPLLFNAA